MKHAPAKNKILPWSMNCVCGQANVYDVKKGVGCQANVVNHMLPRQNKCVHGQAYVYIAKQIDPWSSICFHGQANIYIGGGFKKCIFL